MHALDLAHISRNKSVRAVQLGDISIVNMQVFTSWLQMKYS